MLKSPHNPRNPGGEGHPAFLENNQEVFFMSHNEANECQVRANEELGSARGF